VALGVTYDNIDDYLEGKTLDASIAKTIEGWYLKTEHKRRTPITVLTTSGKNISPLPPRPAGVIFCAFRRLNACYTG
jgi:NH3-dependent NAD+ synthetase